MACRLCFICAAVLIRYANAQPIQLSVKENQPSGTSVGFVTRGAGFLDILDLSQKTDLRYKILTQGNPWKEFFTVNQGTGEISTAAVLDREALCPDQQAICQADIDVAAHSETFLRLFRVELTVVDINDNAPEFSESEVTVSIPESAPIGFNVPIRGATDKDTGKSHGVQKYEIFPADGQFTVSVIENLDGSPEVGIVVGQKLDRELMSSHSVEILAKDGGVPPRTGTVKVTILVTDANDHSPTFSRSVYNISVLENLPVNTSIIQVKATDRDTGVNGKISYRFSPRTVSKFPNFFVTDAASGKILLKDTLDFEARREYRLVVEATDEGNPRQTSQALVIVNVQDVNDNVPVVSFNFLSDRNEAEVSESSQVDDFVAHISVSDRDQGLNSDVDCRTTSDAFKIEWLYDNEFQVMLNTTLDRELISEINVTVKCTDKGNLPLSDTRTFKVIVLDENDNSPYFVEPEYTVTIREDLPIGEEVITLLASDADPTENGKVRYFLIGENKDFFSVNPDSGRIEVSQALDYESKRQMTVMVEARDGGNPYRNSSAVIEVTILDVNDEAPEFNQTTYEFYLKENSTKGAYVGQVAASDPDKNYGGLVTYSLREERSVIPAFSISANGVITTLRPLDRETTSDVTITAIAADINRSSQISSAEVTIRLLDINDNRPVIMFPNDINNTVVLSTDLQYSTVPIATVLAQDADFGENKALVYEMENEDLRHTFRVDSENGSIWLVNKGENFEGRTYTIDILVRDRGNPPLEDVTRLFVVFPLGSSSEISDIASNVTTVIIVICITTLLSILILIGICIVRRSTPKPPRQGAITTDSFGYNVKVEASQNVDVANKSVNENIENKANLILADDTLLQKSETCSPLRLTSDSPIDVFTLSQHGHTGVWLNYSRKNEHLIPRTSSTNSRFTAKSFSQMSLETMASDSGRGVSEADSQENINSHQDHTIQESTNTSKTECPEGDYMDMQRSCLSSISTLPENGRMYSNFHNHRQTSSHASCHTSVHNPSSARQSIFKGSNVDPPFHIPMKNNATIDNYRKGHLAKHSKHTVGDGTEYVRQSSHSDSDDGATTTSGSYTVDFVECAEFDV
ncbi:protocadherin alpha-4-like [Liolophura sinensis]|uniref:protocadherin alpha-4-like n=1 Tax=Liolophura sinensis TaxID=3198878 RepID=UPI003158F0D2